VLGTVSRAQLPAWRSISSIAHVEDLEIHLMDEALLAGVDAADADLADPFR
jgi:hypothetical protein